MNYLLVYNYVLYGDFIFREHGQGTIEEIQNRDFRRELEEREREKDNKATRGRIQDVPQ